MSDDKFDVIVVGAGPAGSSCAYTLAKAGLQVLVLERGEFPGSKNIFGGILYTTILNKLIPKFWEVAPIERHITKRRFSLLSEDSELALEFRTEGFNHPPFNNSFSTLRAKFDKWFAQQAEEAGAVIIPETVVDDLIFKDEKVVGVKARREGGDLFADVVVSAEGANSFLAQRAGLRKEYQHRSMAVAVKEVMGLKKETIEDRFGLEGNEGVAMEFFAGSVGGLTGSAFVYTNRDSLSVGIGATIESLMEWKKSANDILDRFKQHPSIRRLLRGAEPLEFSAHLIPEHGYHGIPQLVRDGLLLVGDAAHLVNSSLYHEGTNLAMASGVLAAETIIEAKNKEDFSKKTLCRYEEKLKASFVLKDLEQYQHVPDFMAENPKFFKDYPELLIGMLREYFTVSETPKSEIWKKILRMRKENISLLKAAKEIKRLKDVLLGPGF